MAHQENVLRNISHSSQFTCTCTCTCTCNMGMHMPSQDPPSVSTRAWPVVRRVCFETGVAFWNGGLRTGWRRSGSGCVPKRVGRLKTGPSQNTTVVSERVRLRTPRWSQNGPVSKHQTRAETRPSQHSMQVPRRGQLNTRRTFHNVVPLRRRVPDLLRLAFCKGGS